MPRIDNLSVMLMLRKSRRYKHYLLILCLAVIAFAQTPNRASCVEGTITVNSKTPLPGVAVELYDLEHGHHSQTKADMLGYYLFDKIRPGVYSIWVDADRHGCILIPKVAVHHGERVRRDFNFESGKRYGSCSSPLTKH